MKAFRGFVIKEFRQIIRDRRTLVVLFGMPVIMVVLFGFAIRNEIEEVPVAVMDHSKSTNSIRLITNIDESDRFQVVALIKAEKEIASLFKGGKIRAVLVIPADFGGFQNRIGGVDVQLITDATDPNLASISQSYMRAILAEFEQSERTNRGHLPSGDLHAEIRMLYNPELRSVNVFVPGLIAVILMLISALMTSISITREKELGSMEILLVSPLRGYHIIAGKVVPYLLLSVINVLTILLLAELVFDVPFRGSLILFMAESLLFIVTALGLGVFISSIVNDQQTAMMIALAGLLLPTVLLSGFIFPIESMPIPLQAISHVIPARWYLVIVKGIMLKGTGISELWMETVILVSIACFFVLLSIKKFKVRLV